MNKESKCPVKHGSQQNSAGGGTAKAGEKSGTAQSPGRKVIITEGEIDAMSVSKMLAIC